ncbi:hypothetical protein D3C79_1035110 [compost metagenome]
MLENGGRHDASARLVRLGVSFGNVVEISGERLVGRYFRLQHFGTALALLRDAMIERQPE